MSMVLLGLVALGGPVTTTAQVLFGPQRIVQQTDADVTQSEYQAVYAADLDGDGDQDVLSASVGDDKIAWYENMDGRGQFGPQRVITTLADGAVWVHAADLDGDGDFDVLSSSWFDNKIAWYENTDGLGTFGPQQVITTSVAGAMAVYTADLDGDGDVDVLSASLGDNKIAWYENTDGLGTFGPQQVITTSAEYVYSVYATDLDGDGDVDVLSASFRDDKIAWYENMDGSGTFGPQQVINIADPDGIVDNGNEGDADGARSVYATDLDGDGDIDVLSASRNYGKVAWYENLGPPRSTTRTNRSWVRQHPPFVYNRFDSPPGILWNGASREVSGPLPRCSPAPRRRCLSMPRRCTATSSR